MAVLRRELFLLCAGGLAGCAGKDAGHSYVVRLIEGPPPPEAPGSDWLPGYSHGELELIQGRFGLSFPPDLIELLLVRRPTRGPDWLGDEVGVRQMLARPFEGISFDVENNALWWPEWGAKPADVEQRRAVLRAATDAAPKLIPVYGHRYLPESPHERGNPVFSVVQSDIIVYGADLQDYLRREFEGGPWLPTAQKKVIPFWSEMVLRRGRSTR